MKPSDLRLLKLLLAASPSDELIAEVDQDLADLKRLRETRLDLWGMCEFHTDAGQPLCDPEWDEFEWSIRAKCYNAEAEMRPERPKEEALLSRGKELWAAWLKARGLDYREPEGL